MNRRHLFIFIPTLVVAIVFDAFWNFIAADVYYEGLKDIGYLEEGDVQPNLVYLIVMELIFIASSMYLILRSLPSRNKLRYALINGAFFGFLILGMVNVVNLAFIKDYSVTMTLVDILRTIILGSLVGMSVVLLHSRLTGSKTD